MFQEKSPWQTKREKGRHAADREVGAKDLVAKDVRTSGCGDCFGIAVAVDVDIVVVVVVVIVGICFFRNGVSGGEGVAAAGMNTWENILHVERFC